MKNKFLVCVPFTGLGLYGGFRGNRWLRNRIKIFKQFVVPSLQAQTDQDFTLWVTWREEEKTNPQVIELLYWLRTEGKFADRVVFTYTGIPFWDDKLEDEAAREKLFMTLKRGLVSLIDTTAGYDQVYWMLQPSDDCYTITAVADVKKAFENPSTQAVTYTKGYICNYNTLETLEYNPNTNPPFFSIKFPRGIFIDAGAHMVYTGPYKSHEYIGDALRLAKFDTRGFLVGTHGENISTHFNHPFGGERVRDVFGEFGLEGVAKLSLPLSIRKKVMRRLPYRAQRKLRYVFGERGWNVIYNWLRN